MKKLVILAIAFSAVLVSCKENKKVEVKEEVAVIKSASDLNNVDVTASVLNWKGAKPTGEHNGTVALKSGGILIENGVITAGEFVVDMSTITNLDMKGKAGAGKIEGHLKSVDFFDVAAYPTAKFVITNVEKKDDKLAVTGNLNIKDVTKSITIPATLSEVDGAYVFKSENFNINRADFNIKYGSKSFFDNLKDKFVDDLVEMSFVVKTKA
ncbi:Protein YceI [Polaribacter huanghezhanensis]|uniref:YceI family protein n=1 Tax=Polaribacter huanghezhanensis TaxID=1354726 RepID=UPI002648DBCA|nr:YceI family protein [Polaribacter huanghezhanensis]WKD85887.1 Protein YceI [Polaribacter huanghezhanensis]